VNWRRPWRLQVIRCAPVGSRPMALMLPALPKYLSFPSGKWVHAISQAFKIAELKGKGLDWVISNGNSLRRCKISPIKHMFRNFFTLKF